MAEASQGFLMSTIIGLRANSDVKTLVWDLTFSFAITRVFLAKRALSQAIIPIITQNSKVHDRSNEIQGTKPLVASLLRRVDFVYRNMAVAVIFPIVS